MTVDYYKTEDFIPDFEAAYPDKFNKMDYMGTRVLEAWLCTCCASCVCLTILTAKPRSICRVEIVLLK